jgi:hypothetical protein
MKTRNAPKRIRSTTAPETSAAVMMQNAASKAKNSSCGISVPARGANPTWLRKASESPPTNQLPLSKASE